jgi:hypothetical protein
MKFSRPGLLDNLRDVRCVDSGPGNDEDAALSCGYEFSKQGGSLGGSCRPPEVRMRAAPV